jgi:DNA-binding transcriptional ArsR family regulator
MDEQPVEIPPEFTPEEEFVIDTIETLRVIADPLRMAILEQIVGAPGSAKQIAAALEIPKTKIYYHMNMLEEHGLVRVIGTRIVSGIIEKWYAARARIFRVDRALFSLGAADDAPALEMFVSTMFDAVRKSLTHSIREQHATLAPEAEPARRLLMARRLMHLDAFRIAALHERLYALIEEFSGQPESSQGANVELLVALFPTGARTGDSAAAQHAGGEPVAVDAPQLSLAAVHAAAARHMRGMIMPPAAI